MRHVLPRLLLALALCMLAASPARALSLASCTASSTPVSFGVYDPLAPSALTASGSVSVSCSLVLGLSLLVSYTVDLSAGSGTYANRTLRSGGNVLSYNLYTTGTYGTIWGNNTGGTSQQSASYLLGVGGATNTFPVYGRILPAQIVRSGAYTDTIVVTVTY